MPYADPEKQKAAQRQHYKNNADDYKSRQTAHRERNRRYIWNHLKQNPCIDCGENDPVVLEFDHRNPAEKVCGISEAAFIRKFSIQRLQEEIDKCDIRCANCHRRKTAQEFGYNQLKY